MRAKERRGQKEKEAERDKFANLCNFLSPQREYLALYTIAAASDPVLKNNPIRG
jgi:hypothetical protein